jgi:hypothetical protein
MEDRKKYMIPVIKIAELLCKSDDCKMLVSKSTESQEVGKNHKRKIIIQEEETQDYNHWRHLK